MGRKILKALQKDRKIFLKGIHILKYLNFQRKIKPDLLIFLDGSKDAYGAVTYVRWQKVDGNYESRLVILKNRIAPIKVVDIVDSEIVETMKNKESYAFSTFAANRIGEIQQKNLI